MSAGSCSATATRAAIPTTAPTAIARPTRGAPAAAVRAMAVGAVVGMAARVAVAEHDPADIAAGAAVGRASARAVALLAKRGRAGA